MIEKLVKDSGEEFYNRSKEILIQIKNKIDISDQEKYNKDSKIPKLIRKLFEHVNCSDGETHNILRLKRVDDVEIFAGGYTAGKFIVFSKKGILYEYNSLDDFYTGGWIIERTTD